MNVAERRAELYGLLCDLPPRNRPVSAEKTGEETREGYLLERLTLDLNGEEPVPAYFIKPADRTPPWPTVLFNHSHGGRYRVGKDEMLEGAPWITQPSHARALSGEGYAALCIDHWVFGQRHNRSEPTAFRHMLWLGRCLWGIMVYDSLKAVDYLMSRPDVDHGRIATLGMSMGSTMGWWLAALDERIKVCVDICCLTDYQELIRTNGLELHGLYYYVPGLLKHFTASQINALIAPRAHLSVAGVRDPLTPPAGLDRIDADLKKAYAQAGVPERWKLLRYDVEHQETPAMRQEELKWLRAWL